MKTLRIDDNAHKLLCKVKDIMKKEGIEKPSMSDVIRYLYNRAFYIKEEKDKNIAAINDKFQLVKNIISKYKSGKINELSNIILTGKSEGYRLRFAEMIAEELHGSE